jgi:hypothetical protein
MVLLVIFFYNVGQTLLSLNFTKHWTLRYNKWRESSKFVKDI